MEVRRDWSRIFVDGEAARIGAYIKALCFKKKKSKQYWGGKTMEENGASRRLAHGPFLCLAL